MQGEAASFGDQLRRYRERAAFTQEALAERAGLTAYAISALERGARRRPHPHTVQALAMALALSDAERSGFVAAARPRAASRDPSITMRTGAPRLTNLPQPPNALIGREREAEAIRDLILGGGSRLVTLTGVGGSGKTRLALEVAAGLASAFPDGVWLVELGPVSDPALVLTAVTAAVGVREAAGAAVLGALEISLREKEALLVLDNCEHLIEACAHLAEQLLATCPAIRMLATSRESLQIGGERQHRVHPLAAPDLDQRSLPDELARYPAVQLFVARAQAVWPDFELTTENVAAVARVCAHVEGIPLAIELAAARMRVLSAEQICERLDDCFRLLVGSSRAAPTRQRTLRATLDWSHDLLTEAERAVFRRLAVFAGGCELSAAESVCSGTGLESTDVLETLTRLVDKSLVLVEVKERMARYRLLEPVRQYGLHQLTAHGETDAVRARHMAFYSTLAERARPELEGPAQVAWLGRLDLERENLRAALSWLQASGDVEQAPRLMDSLIRFWEARGYLSEGRYWFGVQLTAPTHVPQIAAIPAAACMRALLGAGRLAQWQGDLEEAASLLTESLALARRSGDRQAVAEALAWLGTVRRRQCSLPSAVLDLKESLRLYQELGDTRGVAFALLNLGVTARQQGDAARARPILEASLLRHRELGDLRLVAITLTMLGRTLLQLGDFRNADAMLREGFAGHRAVGDQVFVVFCLMDLAGVAAADGRPMQAARWLGAAETMREAVGVALSSINLETRVSVLEAVRAQLPEPALAAAFAAGRAMTMGQVAADLEPACSDSSPASERTAPSSRRGPSALLTRREREVVQLLAEGRTDRQIAEALTIAVSTAGVHVHHILEKLGLHSRWQVADWAAEHGLPGTSGQQ